MRPTRSLIEASRKANEIKNSNKRINDTIDIQGYRFGVHESVKQVYSFVPVAPVGSEG